MIVTEYYSTRADGVRLFITYSDIDHYIIQDQTGIKYESAIDVENRGYTYSESDEVIDRTDGNAEQEQPVVSIDPDEISPEEIADALEELI